MKRGLILTVSALCFAHTANAQLPISIAVLGVDDLGSATRATRTWIDFNRDVVPDCDILIIPDSPVSDECGPQGSVTTLTPAIVADSGPGGLELALAYPLPAAGTQGDVVLLEGGTTRGVLRFNGNGTVIVYSGVGPQALYTNQMTLELASGGARTAFIPVSGQPGYGYRNLLTGQSVPPAAPATGSTPIGNYLSYHFILSAPAKGISTIGAVVDSLGFNQSQNLIQAALSALESGDTPAACGQLTAFVNQVKAQSGKQLTQSEANALILTTSSVMGKVGCF
jgi:hypothetical protein